MTHTKNDPALRPLDQRDAIAAGVAERRHDACTRRTCTVAEAVSMEALEHSYQQVKRLREENDRVRDAAGAAITNLELIAEGFARLDAYKARLVLDEAKKLRVAMTEK